MQGIGLLGLLVVIAIAFYLMFGGSGGGSAGTAQQVQKQAETVGNQISGKDAEGKLATDSLTFEASPKGVLVQAVTPGGAFATRYGLEAGDLITEIGPLAKDQFQDQGTAKSYLHDAFARSESLTVIRSGQRMKLPVEAAPSAGPTPPAQRTTPRNQLEGILQRKDDANNVPTH